MTLLVRNRVLPLFGFVAGFAVLATVSAVYLFPKDRPASAATVGGPFALTSQDGKPVTEAALRGHPSLIFFGYTHCPDVCPTALSQITTLFKALGPDEKAKAYFVTVDPERDTPVVMKDYLSSFDPRITGLTGTPEAVKRMETGYKVYARAVPDKDGTYSMDHTAVTYLMDKRGNFVGAFDLDRPVDQAAADLKQYF